MTKKNGPIWVRTLISAWNGDGCRTSRRRTKATIRTALACCTLAYCLGALASHSAIAAELTRFTLIDADRDLPIVAFDPLPDGATIDLEMLATRNLNVSAETEGAVGSVNFELSRTETATRTEGDAPYALFGESDGDFHPWTPPVGTIFADSA